MLNNCEGNINIKGSMTTLKLSKMVLHKRAQLYRCLLPTPGEAKAKAMPGRLYIHT